MQQEPAVGTVGLFHQAGALVEPLHLCKEMHSNLQVKHKHVETKACSMHGFLNTVTINLQLLSDESLGVSHSSLLLYLETKKAK